ncbi:hypothetical protein Y032_0013g1949 [Ancylostoma ceylanicum]|uniref:Uncharacterized protein n=1 Tax=Ancylostoma ceylanicum TaxID=53326 RepID=A0A016VBC0_9BILA|nr:hypothetical protein Y032_0013g1949 [Ancylostoma ceylanicum]
MACFTATLSLRPSTTKMMITKCYTFSCLITLFALDSMLMLVDVGSVARELLVVNGRSDSVAVKHAISLTY